jgi:hypothetical protein
MIVGMKKIPKNKKPQGLISALAADDMTRPFTPIDKAALNEIHDIIVDMIEGNYTPVPIRS